MHRIDGPTRAAALPAPFAAGTGASSPGYFAHGDLGAGVAPTVLTADWANAVQEEIVGVIVDAGLTPSKTDHGQLADAIDQKIADALAGTPPSSSLGATGYRIHPDGFIEQWGYVSGGLANEVSGAITFPIAFPSACFGVSGTVINSSQSTAGNTQIQEVSVSTTGATVFFQSDTHPYSDGAGGFRWRATGH